MALITTATNIDYLISDVRLRIGDLDKRYFSDTVVRTALVNGVKFLQSKWQRRYQVYDSSMFVDPQPSDGTVPAGYIYAALPQGYNYIPSGLSVYDVFRNPYVEFADPSVTVVLQEDEYPITVAAKLFLRESLLSSSQQTFVNWSDGEYSYSNVAASQVMRGLSADALAELNNYFKARRTGVLRSSFATFV
jgi:hypothetical protein